VTVPRQAPADGWLRQVRRARGVTQQALADALGCKRQACAQLERSEARGAISLYSLRKAAAAMDCELVYALVPRGAREVSGAAVKEADGEQNWAAGGDLPTTLL
jgi:predicted DNA-binding mobile mystery protein A